VRKFRNISQYIFSQEQFLHIGETKMQSCVIIFHPEVKTNYENVKST